MQDLTPLFVTMLSDHREFFKIKFKPFCWLTRSIFKGGNFHDVCLIKDLFYATTWKK